MRTLAQRGRGHVPDAFEIPSVFLQRMSGNEEAERFPFGVEAFHLFPLADFGKRRQILRRLAGRGEQADLVRLRGAGFVRHPLANAFHGVDLASPRFAGEIERSALDEALQHALVHLRSLDPAAKGGQ